MELQYIINKIVPKNELKEQKKLHLSRNFGYLFIHELQSCRWATISHEFITRSVDNDGDLSGLNSHLLNSRKDFHFHLHFDCFLRMRAAGISIPNSSCITKFPS